MPLPLLLALLACKPAPDDTAAAGHEPATYPLAEGPYTTLQGVWAPVVPDAATAAAIDDESLTIRDHGRFADFALGVEWTSGNPWLERSELAPGFVEGSERHSVAWIWQLADPQLIDEESPIRLEAFDQLYRPQGHLSVQVYEAHVRTADAIAEVTRPFDFALFAGDLTDGAQENELDWFLAALAGADIDPDSGEDDDPVPGPGNDYNDPFTSTGLDAPWYAVLGNHDALYIGGFGEIDTELEAAAMAGEAFDHDFLPVGWLDGSTEHAELRTEGAVAPDPRRRPLRDDEMIQRLHDAPGLPEGHGLADSLDTGWFSTRPMPDKPVRLIGLHTVDSSKVTSQGVMSAAQHTWLQAELAQAEANNELVIVLSHHRATDFASSSDVSGDELAATLAASDAVAVHVVGHGHNNTVAVYEDTIASHAYHELMLASTVDFPMQSRLIELVWEGNNYLSIVATNLDHNSREDSLAHYGRHLAAAQLAFPGFGGESDIAGHWLGELEDQNLILRLSIPERIATELGAHDWPGVESDKLLEL